jgi:hypothetical protein
MTEPLVGSIAVRAGAVQHLQQVFAEAASGKRGGHRAQCDA